MTGAGSGRPAPDDERHPVEVLTDEFLARRRRGDAIEPDVFAAEFPEHADELRALLPTVLAMELLKGKRNEESSGGSADLGAARPERLGDYRITHELGRGGMGIVYEAEQESLHRPVALKVLPRRALLDPEQLERFRREAATAAGLHHTNIVPVFGVGEQDDLHYYVMQRIRGLGLDEIIDAWRRTAPKDGAADEAPGPLSRPRGSAHWTAVARVGVQIAGALHHAHEHGVLHRDVKPSNLLFEPTTGHVWITDFGLAKVLEAADVSRSGRVVGTLRYLAPEQLQGDYDERSDVYGLGLVLYELAALEPAYAEDDRTRLIERLASGRRASLRQLAPTVPRDLARVIEKACAPLAADRYADAGELEADLHRFLDGDPVRARPLSALEQAWRWARRNRAVAALAATTALAITTAAVVGWIGNARLESALDRERAASTRAEQTIQHTFVALERLFAEVAGPTTDDSAWSSSVDDAQDGDSSSTDTEASAPLLTATQVATLESILEIYTEFARTYADTTDRPQLPIATAHDRLGAIHERLGHTAAAIASYGEALQRYARLPATEVQRAAVHNRLGRLERLHDRQRALTHHGEALRLLGQDPDARSPRATLELARTHLELGNLALRPERGPEGPGPGPGRGGRRRGPRGERATSAEDAGTRPAAVAPFETAIELGESLAAVAPDDRERLLIVAAGYRGVANAWHDVHDPVTAAAAESTAIELLERLAGEHPEAVAVQFELALVYTDACHPRALRFDADRTAERLRRATAILDGLHAESTESPTYALALARVLARRSDVARLDGDKDAELAHLRRSVELLDDVSERVATDGLPRRSARRLRLRLAACLVERDDLEGARTEWLKCLTADPIAPPPPPPAGTGAAPPRDGPRRRPPPHREWEPLMRALRYGGADARAAGRELREVLGLPAGPGPGRGPGPGGFDPLRPPHRRR